MIPESSMKVSKGRRHLMSYLARRPMNLINNQHCVMQYGYTDTHALYSFFSYSCLTVLAEISTTTLNKSGDSIHPCLVPDLVKPNFSSFCMMLTISMIYIWSLLCLSVHSPLLYYKCWVFLREVS